MSTFSDILKGGLEGILGPVTALVDVVHTSDEEKSKALLEAQEKIISVFNQLEEAHIAETNAKRDVMVAELNQSDVYTKRARPTVVYFGLVSIFICYILFAFVTGLILAWNSQLYVTVEGVKQMVPLAQIPLPEQFWWTWGGTTSVYAIGRSAEKRGVQNKLVGAITGSSSMGDLFKR